MSFVVAISGLSGSGKTTLAARLAEEHGALNICLDNYYKPTDPDAFESTNFESPAMIDAAAAASAVADLCRGRDVAMPLYDFTLCRCTGERMLRPAPLVVVEGQYAAIYDEILAVSHLRVLVDTDVSTCRHRRMERDCSVFGRTRSESSLRFDSEVLCAYHSHRTLLEANSDLIVADGDLDAWVAAILPHYRKHLESASSCS